MLNTKDNFTESSSLLKKEKKRRLEPDFTPDESLENKLWVFLYNIGFNKLNIGRGCQVSYGRESKSLETKSVDIVAESDDVRLYIECSMQQDTLEKINHDWIQHVEGIRKYENNNDKNIAFVFFTNQDVSESVKTKLREKRIKLLNEKLIEYFNELIKRYKKLAYYQLLGYLLEGQSIKKFKKEDLSIPAIRCKYKKKEFCYLFGIQPEKLIPLATVIHRKMGGDNEVAGTYQRLVKKEKIKEIKEFISKNRGVFPTNIIIKFDVKGKDYFKPIGKQVNEIQFGILTLPDKYQSITVIDGQHRLFAYDGLKEAESDLIYVIGFQKMDIESQVQTFVDINDNQTPVPPSLMWDLYPLILESDDIKARIATIIKKLNSENEASALYGAISYDSAPYSEKGSKITLESLCTAIKSCNVISKIETQLDYMEIDSKDDKTISNIIAEYFNSIQELNTEHWNRKEKTNNLLRSNQGIGALVRLFVEIWHYLLTQNKLNCLKKNDFNTLRQEFKNLLTPVNNRVLKLKTTDDIKKFKKIGEHGKQQIFMEFVNAIIEGGYSDFAPETVKKQKNIELENWIQELKENAEHSTLEAKESFFADTNRLKSTKQLCQNSEDAIRGIIKTVVAFSNYKGGNIIIGLVDKSFEPVGLDDTDLSLKKDWETLKNAMTQKIKAEISGLPKAPEIERYFSNTKTIAVIKVIPLDKKRFEENDLCVLKHDNNCYKRENGDSVPIYTNEIRKYCQQVLKEFEDETQVAEEQND